MGSPDMVSPSQWLDVVWSLTILDQANSEHFASVLSEKFINQLTSFDFGKFAFNYKIMISCN